MLILDKTTNEQTQVANYLETELELWSHTLPSRVKISWEDGLAMEEWREKASEDI